MSWKKYSLTIGILFILYGLIGFLSPPCQALIGGVTGPHYWQCQWFVFKFKVLPEFVQVFWFSFIISIIIGFVILIFLFREFKKVK
jgi:MFS family permease